jgi:2-oxoglutarate ferredoxin oxidoreductase subunit alpha
MTSSSSPGISLKSEGISYIAGSDLPCVIVNVQRGGPGLGGIQPSQSDYRQAVKAAGHGDFHMLVYAPSSVQETVDMTYLAFDTADKYRMPAMILSDGLIGQMMEPVEFPDREVTVPEKPWACSGHRNKRKHNIINSLYLQPDVLEQSVLSRFERYKDVEENCTAAEEYLCEDADIVITAFGAAARIARSAVVSARECGIKAGLFRPKTLYPFPVKELNNACEGAKCILDTEMNMGQMIDDVRLATECRLPVYFYGRTGGNIPAAADILDEIVKINERSCQVCL